MCACNHSTTDYSFSWNVLSIDASPLATQCAAVLSPSVYTMTSTGAFVLQDVSVHLQPSPLLLSQLTLRSQTCDPDVMVATYAESLALSITYCRHVLLPWRHILWVVGIFSFLLPFISLLQVNLHLLSTEKTLIQSSTVLDSLSLRPTVKAHCISWYSISSELQCMLYGWMLLRLN